MRVIHVVPSIAEEASGPSYSVPRLCEALIATGMDVQLAALNWADLPVNSSYLKIFPFGFGPRRLGVSPSMQCWLEEEASSGRADLIHNHSLWMMPNVYAGRASRQGRRPLIVSPRGTLSTWALGRSSLKKRLFWPLLQEPVLRSAACFHATAESEYEDIRRRGFKQPVVILPNGIDLPRFAEKVEGGRRILLFLGRIHPIKGVDILLTAWQALEHRFLDWELHIAGPDNNGYLAEMRALAAHLHLKRVVFTGLLLGEEKWLAYRAADLFVLPTHTENFGMTVAESLASATPAIVTKGAPWSGLGKQGAGWWIDIGVGPLIACLEDALALPAMRLAEMGQAGHEWMKREYSRDRIAAQLTSVYRWLLTGGVAPACVRVD
jgi:glycosyltransferase involved in cell wall biosynthesis